MLVVDDRTGVRRVAGNHLTAFGDQVIEAASGREALNQLAADDSIALLFTDVIMPGGLSGPELAQRARELRPDLKVLFTSGYAETAIDGGLSADRSEERRVGKECVRTCKSRWSPYHYKNKTALIYHSTRNTRNDRY